MLPNCAILLLCFFLIQPCAWAETIKLKINKAILSAEIADTAQSRTQGLMYRSQLCADCGMLFVFEEADRLEFWMKDTPLPLSIAFIATDGRILNIEDMQPKTTGLHSARGEALYALEMERGWFAQHGIVPGGMVQGLQGLRAPEAAR